MKEKQVLLKEQDRQDRKPRYIQGLIDKAKNNKRVYERKLANKRSQDQHLYADKISWWLVLSAHKAEQAKLMKEEGLGDDVTTKADLNDFYFNLSKNITCGSGDADKGKSKKHPDEAVVQPPHQVSSLTTGASSDSSRMAKRHQDEIAGIILPRRSLTNLIESLFLIVLLKIRSRMNNQLVTYQDPTVKKEARMRCLLQGTKRDSTIKREVKLQYLLLQRTITGEARMHWLQ